MKTETQIAKRFIKLRNGLVVSQCHKESCQRFLEFLRELRNYRFKCGFNEYDLCDVFEDNKDIENKIKDLQGAIKVYENENI